MFTSKCVTTVAVIFPIALWNATLKAQSIYWIDSGAQKIQRSKLDGSQVEDLVTRNLLDNPEQIALNVAAGTLYWTDRTAGKILRADMDGSNATELVIPDLVEPVGIAVDAAGGKFYWTDPGSHRICRADLDGANAQVLVVSDTLNSRGIALDPDAGKMYWVDAAAQKIQRADLNGSNIEDLVTTGLDAPHAIGLDVAAGKMYWADEVSHKIQRADLDGSNVEDLVFDDLYDGCGAGIVVIPDSGKMCWVGACFPDRVQCANLEIPGGETPSTRSDIEVVVTDTQATPGFRGLALDPMAGKLYWVQDNSRIRGEIRRVNLDGSNNEEVLTEVMASPNHIALDLAAGKMYWTDRALTVQRADLDGSNIETIVRTAEEDIDSGDFPGIALDLDAENVYWVDRDRLNLLGRIKRADLDGSNVQTVLVDFGPEGIALDPVGEKIYWANQVDEHRVRRANLVDGSAVENLTGHSLQSNPVDVALDLVNSVFYFTDAGQPTVRIRRGNLDGSDVGFVFSDLDSVSGIALDVPAGKMYWGDPDNGIIHRGNMDGTDAIADVVTGLDSPIGIALDLSVCGNGVVEPGEECDDGNNVESDPCFSTCEWNPDEIPTVSEWGLAVMTLLILAVGSVLAARYRRAGT